MLYIIQPFLGFIVILLAGKTIRSFTRLHSLDGITGIFADLMLGFYFLVSIFAVIKTGGISISVLFLFWMILWGVLSKGFQKPNFNTFRKWEGEFLTELFFILLLLVIWNYWKYFPSNYKTPAVINRDAISDVTRSIYLSYTGLENSNTNYIQLPSGSQPYHYFEAWCVSFFAGLFKGNFWITQGIVFQPIILIITYTGFRSLTNTEAWNWKAITFGICLFFASGILIQPFQSFAFFQWTDALQNNIIDEPWWTRLSVLYPIVIATIHFARNRECLNSIMVLLLLPYLSVTPAIPVIATCFSLLFVGLFFRKDQLGWQWLWLLLPLLCAFLYKEFYTIFKDTSDFIALPTLKDVLQECNTVPVIRTKIIMIIEKLLQTGFLFMPLWFPILILRFKKIFHKLYWLGLSVSSTLGWTFVGILMIISLVMWQALYFSFGASFFYYYTVLPFLNIGLVWFLWETIKEKSSSIRLGGTIYIILLTAFLIYRSVCVHQKATSEYYISKYEPAFIEQINQYFVEHVGKKGLKLGVKLEAHEEIVHPFFNDGVNLCGYYLYGIADAPALISLSRADIPQKKLQEFKPYETFTKHTAFYTYVKENNALNQPQKIDSLKLQFVLNNKFQYGVVSPKGIIPVNFIPIIDTIFTSKLSGEKFIAFKRNKL